MRRFGLSCIGVCAVVPVLLLLVVPPAQAAHRLHQTVVRGNVKLLEPKPSRSHRARPRTNVLPDAGPNGFATWQGVGAGTLNPADATGAIGPTHYLEVTNGGAAAYNRSNHAQTASATLATLVADSNSPCDPYVIYDFIGSRFYYTAIRCDGTTTANKLYYGWSKTVDPSNFSTGWCHFSVDTTTTRDDVPKLGQNNEHVAIGTNNLNTAAGNSALGSFVTFIRKPASAAAANACTPPPGTTSSAVPAPFSSPVPANQPLPMANGHIVSAQSFAGGSIEHIAYSGTGAIGPASVVNSGATAVPGYGPPTPAQMPGTSTVIATGDARLTNAVGIFDPSAGEAVWTQHTIFSATGRSAVRWYEFVYPAAPFLLQSGTVDDPVQWFFNGAISPTALGNEAILQFNASGATAPQFPQVIAMTHPPGSPPGTMTGMRWVYTASRKSSDPSCSGGGVSRHFRASARGVSAAPCRWGEYAGASPDPANTRGVWGTNMTTPTAAPIPGKPDWTTRNFGLSTSEVSVFVNGSTLNVQPADDQGNRISVDPGAAGATVVTERSWPTVAALMGCAQTNPITATCSAGPTALSVDLLSFNDSVINNTSLPSTLNGGPGADIVTGGSGDDNLTGGPGVDQMFGRGGTNTLNAVDGTTDQVIDCGGSGTANVDAADVPNVANCTATKTP